jgi:nitrate/TMAO reductase-like tetraheme cytochrome c subunit
MKRLGRWIKKIFLPPADAGTAIRLLPYGIIIIVLMALALGTTKAWEVTNQTVFCGTACHTMPPQYITHQLSDHARVTCEECHLGRTDLPNQIVRKIQYSYQTGSATVMNSYTYPIFAENMRPANDVCETCHLPQTVTSDKLIELKEYREDEVNTIVTTRLIMKTGGGSQREGLGFGIHWHIENPVSFIALDNEKQEIPYIRVETADGSIKEYFDIESGFTSADIDETELESMDCISCHNRAAHLIERPEDKINELMARAEISPDIPYIRNMAGAVFRGDYSTMEEAKDGIYSLIQNYKSNLPQEYADYKNQIDGVADTLWDYYQTAVFMDQKMDWNTHPDNSQHEDSPGCFRCHDGQHLTEEKEAVRLECNLCHSIPVVSGPEDFVTNIEVGTGVEPDSHKNTNWISFHHDAFDDSCKSCHTVEDPGGSSNTSFCSNSGCHGQSWEYVGFDAPRLRQILETLIPSPTPEPTLPSIESGSTVYYADISGLFNKCISCHSAASAQKGVDLSGFTAIMAGGDDGPIVIPGEADNSMLVQIQSGTAPHFAQFTPQELELVKAWINSGANLNGN